jgi:hypothetical protein
MIDDPQKQLVPLAYARRRLAIARTLKAWLAFPSGENRPVHPLCSSSPSLEAKGKKKVGMAQPTFRHEPESMRQCREDASMRLAGQCIHFAKRHSYTKSTT